MKNKKSDILLKLTENLIQIISDTNGISIQDTLECAVNSHTISKNKNIHGLIVGFRQLLTRYQRDVVSMDELLDHPVSKALEMFFKKFPLRFKEDHIHLTGSMRAEFIYPHLEKLLKSPQGDIYQKQIEKVYGLSCLPLQGVESLSRLISLEGIRSKSECELKSKEKLDPSSQNFLAPHEQLFQSYLNILLIPKLILNSREIHKKAVYSMAQDLYTNYNIGQIRLKFTLSRISQLQSEFIPGIEALTAEDVVLGIYDGLKSFQKEHNEFHFILSPCFRKEMNFYDSKNFPNREADSLHQVDFILGLLSKYPELKPHLCEVDTVGAEQDLYKKKHFNSLKRGLLKLKQRGFFIRSHHGELWQTLRLGVQAVDNALNIWHIDNLEHGLSLGINPNYYFHCLFEKVLLWNQHKKSLSPEWIETKELMDMDWRDHKHILNKLLNGEPLEPLEQTRFARLKFITAREVEHYQHDVLNRMIYKNVSLTSLPSSNIKLTGRLPDYKDHPFSWWEKKGVKQTVGTDNYITLNTNFIREMLILLFSDAKNLKITKLLMVTTGETRRIYLSNLLWEMRKDFQVTH